MLGIGAELGPEGAADVGGDDPDLRDVDSQLAGQRALGALGALVRDPGRRRPSSPHAAAADRDSIGAGATRWLMMVMVTTASQPSNRSSAALERSPNSIATLVPAAGNSRVVPSLAPVRLTTAGSGS